MNIERTDVGWTVERLNPHGAKQGTGSMPLDVSPATFQMVGSHLQNLFVLDIKLV